MTQVEPVFCHAPETLRLVQAVRLLDESIRQAPPEKRESLKSAVRDLVARVRAIAARGPDA